MEHMNDLGRTLKDAATRASAERSAKAATDLARRAAEEGLADIAYDTVESPVGPLVAAATPRGVLRISYDHDQLDRFLEELARLVSPRILEASGMPGFLDPLRRQLDEYFEGRRKRFDLPLDWRLARGFGRRVLRRTARIPYGQVATYTEVASAAGNARASRAAGNALGANPMPIVVPCHRVVRQTLDLGGYGGGLERKAYLLELEGALEGLAR
jgi:methylated-DNA-[protein]-cysteine S-methyltransferase